MVMMLGLWAAFSLSAAEVRVEERGVRYRRFRGWKLIAYAEIFDCRLCPWALYGSESSKSLIAPWGKLYLVTLHWHQQILVDAINGMRLRNPSCSGRGFR